MNMGKNLVFNIDPVYFKIDFDLFNFCPGQSRIIILPQWEP